MSFIRIRSFLPDAFRRIDARGRVRDTHNLKYIESVLTLFFPRDEYTLGYKNGMLIIYSSSASLKQKITMSKKQILEKISAQNGSISVSDIVFKGPRT